MASGVINTMDALSGGCWRSYAIYRIPKSWYWTIISQCNAINGITIIVNPAEPLIYTDNINNVLLFLSIDITATIQLLLYLIVCNTGFWGLHNTIMLLSIICWNISAILI